MKKVSYSVYIAALNLGHLDVFLVNVSQTKVCLWFFSDLLADIVNCDLKSTLRVLYNLFTKYRNVE